MSCKCGAVPREAASCPSDTGHPAADAHPDIIADDRVQAGNPRLPRRFGPNGDSACTLMAPLVQRMQIVRLRIESERLAGCVNAKELEQARSCLEAAVVWMSSLDRSQPDEHVAFDQLHDAYADLRVQLTASEAVLAASDPEK